MIQSEETQEFIAQSIFRMEENLPRIEKCFKELSEEEIWQKPNSSSNSVGNLVLHLCGNITQYIIASLGEKTDLRNRDLEFSKTDGFNKKELLDQLTSTINSAIQVIKHCNSADLLKIRSVQGFNFSGMGIIIHVVEHLSYHTGQIAFWTKLLKDKDLGFYKGIDLNQKNK